ncbi:hypothetical protein DW881_07355 [Exiguobacterium sp. AM39-5BH]|nr:hypothetical protein DW881_07355 [Exiguobacterium sp. AM39-5BH]
MTRRKRNRSAERTLLMSYCNALNRAHTTGIYNDLIALVATEVETSLDLYLSAIAPHPSKDSPS